MAHYGTGQNTISWRWVPLQEDAADESKNDWGENSQFNFSHLNLMTATNRRWYSGRRTNHALLFVDG